MSKEYLIEQAKSNSTAPLVDLLVWLEFKLGLDLDDLALHKFEFEGSRDHIMQQLLAPFNAYRNMQQNFHLNRLAN